jgi:hypothetical protein
MKRIWKQMQYAAVLSALFAVNLLTSAVAKFNDLAGKKPVYGPGYSGSDLLDAHPGSREDEPHTAEFIADSRAELAPNVNHSQTLADSDLHSPNDAAACGAALINVNYDSVTGDHYSVNTDVDYQNIGPDKRRRTFAEFGKAIAARAKIVFVNVNNVFVRAPLTASIQQPAP